MKDDALADEYADFDARYRGAGVERKALSGVPVVDLSEFTGGPAARKAAVAEKIRQACIDIGFFYLVGHGIRQAEFDEAHGLGLRLFGLPLEEKMKLHTTNSSVQQGYIRTGGVNPDAESIAKADVKERYGMAREVFPGEPAEGRYSAGRSQWPDDAVLPGFAKFMKTHLQKRVEIGQVLARAFALSLELRADYFDEAFRFPGCSLFFNYYPPLDPEAAALKKWSFSPHTDYGAFTLLSQDSLGGLQVRNSAGEWIDIPPLEDSFVVNVADMFAMWTNDTFTSSLHRALNVSNQARISLALFFHPNGATRLRCLETCRSASNPERYPPVIAEEYMGNLVRQMNRTGRPGISSKTAQRLTTG